MSVGLKSGGETNHRKYGRVHGKWDGNYSSFQTIIIAEEMDTKHYGADSQNCPSVLNGLSDGSQDRDKEIR